MHQNNPPYIILLEVLATWAFTILSFVSSMLPLFQLAATILAILVSMKALGVFILINRFINKVFKK